MTEIARLAKAIATISEVYLTRVVAKGDVAGIQKWSARLADYASRLAVLTAPALAPIEEAMLAGHDHVLTYDEEMAIFLDAQDAKLKELGRPYGRNGAERGALPLFTHIEMADALGLPLMAAEFRSLIVAGTAQ